MNRIYVAGPYSGNTLETFKNMRNGMRKATELLLRGYAPFCPWLDYHYSLMTNHDETLTVQMYYDYSLAWLEVCDAVLLVDGWQNSKGTLEEIARAERLGIPVFKPWEEEAMYDYFEVLHPGFVVSQDLEDTTNADKV